MMDNDIVASNWLPMDLRWSAQGILQQRWTRMVISYDASMCEVRHIQEEWRDVPREGP